MNLAESTIVGRLDLEEQRQLVAELGEIKRLAPLFRPSAGGEAMSVFITNAGDVGWMGDAKGYRYDRLHPVTGKPWPRIPQHWLDIADRFVDRSAAVLLPWDCAHVVFYKPGAKLGQHRDKTEADKRGQIVTISLGDPAVFRVENEDGVRSETVLVSGTVNRLAGETRNLLHEIRRVDTNPTADMLNPSPLSGPGRVVISVRSGAGAR